MHEKIGAFGGIGKKKKFCGIERERERVDSKCTGEFEMQIGFNMDDSGLDKIRSNTSCRQPASGELAYSASLRQVHSSALHQAPTASVTQ